MSWCKPSQAKPIGGGESQLIGEIFFAPGSSTLTNRSRKAIDNLADVIKTWPKGVSAVKLSFVGDTDRKDPKSKRNLAKERALAVRNYLLSNLRVPLTIHNLSSKIHDLTKLIRVGAEQKDHSFRRPLERLRVVQMINHGPPMRRLGTGAVAAKSPNECQFVIAATVGTWLQSFGGTTFGSEQRKRIRYWTIGKGSHSVWKSRNDQFISTHNPLVAVLVGEKSALSKERFEEDILNRKLPNRPENQIRARLMKVGGYGTNVKEVYRTLIQIDKEIFGGLQFLASSYGSGAMSGFKQLNDYVKDRYRNPNHFYYAYYKGNKIP